MEKRPLEVGDVIYFRRDWVRPDHGFGVIYAIHDGRVGFIQLGQDQRSDGPLWDARRAIVSFVGPVCIP